MDFAIQEITFHPLSQRDRLRIWAISTWRRSRNSWMIFARNRLAVLGLVLLLIYFLMALLHPLLIQTVWAKKIYDPVVGHDMSIFPHPSMPSLMHPLGTDTLGRDVLSILMAATAPSLQMAFTAAFTAAAVGTIVGALSALYRGTVDYFFAHLTDIVLLVPAPIIMVIFGFVLDINPFQFGLLYGILVGTGGVAVVLRSHALTIVNKPFVDAARVAGAGPIHLLSRHIIPHMVPLAAVNMLLTVTGAIFANGFVAFLGLSRAQLNWGSMIYDSFTYQNINGMLTWNVLISSSLAISLFAASFYLIALGLNNVVDPRFAEHVAPERQRNLRYESERVLQVSFLVANFSNEDNRGNKLSLPSQEGANQDPTSEGILILKGFGGYIEQVKDKTTLVSFGLESHLPPRLNALLAVQGGIKLLEYIDEVNRQRVLDKQSCLKVGIGIASGPVTLRCINDQRQLKDGLSGNTILTARKLHRYADFMKSSCLLINEEAYNCIAAVRHHVIFGRKGPVKLPGSNVQKMAYEIIGDHNISKHH